MNKELLIKTFRNTTFTAIYIFLVSQVMNHGSMWFGEKDTFLTPFAVLLLFSLSAAVVGGLILGQSVMLFLDGKRKESVVAAIYSIGWLGVFTLLSMIAMVVMK